MILHGETVRLRPVEDTDAERLTEILTAPGVRESWPGFDLERVRAEMLDDDEVVVFAVEVDDQVVGLIQYGEETDPDYRSASIDIALHDDHHGRGLGPDAVRTLARHLFDGVGHHRITIDPAATNQRAIRSYQRVGFRPVGVMRRYERGADGTWHDGLLMDLLPEDCDGTEHARDPSPVA